MGQKWREKACNGNENKMTSRFELRALKCQNIAFVVIEFYAPQTTMLEGRTNRSECAFDALFKDS